MERADRHGRRHFTVLYQQRGRGPGLALAFAEQAGETEGASERDGEKRASGTESEGDREGGREGLGGTDGIGACTGQGGGQMLTRRATASRSILEPTPSTRRARPSFNRLT